LSERIELSKIKITKKILKGSESSRVYEIQVTGQLPSARNIIMLRGKK
jgi:hypothetical protein